jgi:D-alanyl-D-alanine-carboxypeptidase/D-alanyl-D-alanine-endopeptidase
MALRRVVSLVCFAVLAFGLTFSIGLGKAAAEDKLLAESVDFTGTFIFLGAKVPSLVIGATRNGETVVRGFGEMSMAAERRQTATR